MKRSVFILLILLHSGSVFAQERYVSKVWVGNNGDGTYKNPILHADYSDPDAIRVGNDYYMIASSFEDVPGLPILHSKDLVNWKLIGHALKRQLPLDHFSATRHGEGVWAPAIRFHKGEFYIFYPDPDFGIYLTKAKTITGPWSEPRLVVSGKGLIDPCPLWDDDEKVYLVHAFAGSRAGIKSVIVIKQLNSSGTKTLDEGVLVYDGHDTDPTIEGPKFYKRSGYYYIFAPAGGVATGWQLVLRSKNIYGPYQRKVVMDQGASSINGPHQGAWITTQTGEDWFLHFQDKKAYGRVVHLQPMKWIADWPVIGIDKDGDGKGEPVLRYKKPSVGRTYPIETPAENDEFESRTLGLQWQWMANPAANMYFMNPATGSLRLYAQKLPDSIKTLWDAPNILLQKFPAEEFRATTKLSFKPNKKTAGERAGLVLMGLSYAGIALKSKADGVELLYIETKEADKGKKSTEETVGAINAADVYLRVEVREGAKCNFSYSLDGKTFMPAGQSFVVMPGKWKGAKVGLFCTKEVITNDAGWMDVDWFRVESLQ
jgi:beta-xylosidase